MAFKYVLTDLAGVERGELPGAKGKSLSLPIGSMATAGVTLRVDHADADFMLEGDALLKVYDDEVSKDEPLFHGRLITAEEVAGSDAATVAAAFADPFWILLRRLVGKSPAGYSRGTALAQVDRGLIIAELLAATNAESPSGVRMGANEPSSNTYVAGWTYARLAEKIAELGATLDGPDWRVRAIEWDAGYYGELDVKPSIGAVNLDAAFEFGGEGVGNVKSYRRVVSLEGTINRGFQLPPGFPENATQAVIQRDHLESQAARGLLEDVVTGAGELTVDDLRVKLLEHHIAVRHGPRQTITFDPVSDLGDRVPRFGRDYELGDVVPFRASVVDQDTGEELVDDETGRSRKRIDALVRVYQVAAAIDEAGAATYTLTVAPS